MEFIQEFAVIQGTLLSLQKKVGLLKNLCESDVENREKIRTVVQTLLTTINSLKDVDSSRSNPKMKQISLFLTLNSSLSTCELLVEDANCGHLLNSAPTLSSDILINIFCEPMLSNYFYELVVCCPPLLSVELLEVAVRNLKEHTLLDSACAITFTKAIYVKLLMLQNERGIHKCELDCVALKLMGYYTKFCEYFADYSRIHCKSPNVEVSEHFGEKVFSSLQLVTSCLMYYINPVELSANDHDVFKMNILFDYKQWHQESDDTIFDIMHQQLLSILLVQIVHITVDIWLEWAEIDSIFTSNYSLQKDIAESMYKCGEVIQASIKKGIKLELVKDLVPILSSMASKPRDEDDEIEEADMALIVRRISDNSFCQKKWLIALFKKTNEVFTKEEIVKCVEKNIHLMDSEVVSFFLEKYLLFVEKEVCILSERIKQVILQSVKQLSLREQLDILEKIFNEYGINTHLCSEEYNLHVTKIFNSVVDENDICNDEKYKEFVNLSLQNPLDVIKRILKQGVASDKQAKIMADILQMLRPFHLLQVKRSSQDSHDLLLSFVHEIMKEHNDMEFSDSSFISLMTLLSTTNVISSDNFVKLCLLPLLHTSLTNQNWSEVVLWLETLQVFMDNTIKPSVSLDLPSLLLTLAQIIELSRQHLYSFSCTSMIACEYAIRIVNSVFESFSIDKQDDTTIILRHNIIRLTSPINLFYFFHLWSECENYPDFTIDWKVYLLHWMYMEKCNLQPPWSCSSDLHRKKLVFELVQILPFCVQNEWRTITQNLLNITSPTFCEISNTFVFECFIDVIELISLMCSSPCLSNKERDCTLLCLDYCIRNFAVVLKEELTGKSQTLSPVVVSGLMKKISHLNYVLPVFVQESCAGLLLNILVDIITCVTSDMQMYLNDNDEEERHLNNSQCDKIIKDLSISIMIIEDPKVRQALARKLQDELGALSRNNLA